MLRNLNLQATDDSEGIRLDAYILSQCPTSTRAFVRDALARGDITVDGRPALKGIKVHSGANVEIIELLEEIDNRINPNPLVVLDTVYEDENFLAVNKESGISVHPLSPRENNTLLNGIVAKYPQIADVGEPPLAAGAVHRIDAGTSGLVIIAKDNETFNAMRAAFAERKVIKKYLALVEGNVIHSGKISCELVHDPTVTYCHMIDKLQVKRKADLAKLRPMYAQTAYKPIKKFKSTTLLEVTILTGVTHQIRAQLSMTGHPIVGDTLYGAKKSKEGTFRLHSLSAEFIHPITGTPIILKSPLPNWA